VRYEGFAFGGYVLSSSNYHREQAKILAGLALSTNDPREADRFKLAAMEHLQRAEAVEGAGNGPPHAPKPRNDKHADRD
jgi:hypothetical protein